MEVAYYQSSLTEFTAADPAAILGILTRYHGFALEHQQRGAWETQISLLQAALTGNTDGHILFEFAIPRMGKRADVVLLIGGVVLVLEFKVGSDTFDRHAIEQAHDYALDLKNFHKGSHDLPIIPAVIATAASSPGTMVPAFASDQVAEPLWRPHHRLLTSSGFAMTSCRNRSTSPLGSVRGINRRRRSSRPLRHFIRIMR